jgi:hypothetical protein
MPAIEATRSGPSPDQSSPPPPTGPSGWTAGRVIGAGASGLGAAIGVALLLGGLALIGVHSFARDDDGYYTTSTEELVTDSYAVTTDEIDLGADPAAPAPEDFLGALRVSAERTDGGPVFVGIGPTVAVEAYLTGVARAELADFDDGTVRLDERPGAAPRTPPESREFWAATSEGAGRQAVEWDAETGTWTVAVMNADGERGISVDAEAGARIGWLLWAGLALAAIGALLAGGLSAMILRIRRRATAPPSAPSR